MAEEDEVREHLNKLDIQSMGPDGLHPQVLRELADVIMRPLSNILEQSLQLKEVPEDWKRTNHSYFQKVQEGRSGELQTSHPHLNCCEGDGENPPWNHFQIREGQEGDQE